MIESLFYFLVLVAVGVTAAGFVSRKGVVVAFGGLLFLMCGLLIADTSPTSGIENEVGEFVRHIGDGNYNIDVNIWHKNSGNDSTLFVLSNVLLYGGLSIVLSSFVIMVSSYQAARKRRG